MKKVLFLILISIIVAAAGRYVFYSVRFNLKEDTQAVLPITNPSPLPSDETATWKTLTNTQFGYVIKYPPDWSFSADQHSNPLISNLSTFQSESTCNITDNLCSTIQLYVEKSDNKNDLTPILTVNLKGPNPDRITNKTSIKINGEDASEFDFFGANYRNAVGTLIHTVVANHNGRKYNLSFLESSFGGDSVVDNTKWKNKHIFDLVLSTLKFLDQNKVIDAAKWNTYTNPDNTFSFQYPIDWNIPEVLSQSTHTEYLFPKSKFSVRIGFNYSQTLGRALSYEEEIEGAKKYATKITEVRVGNIPAQEFVYNSSTSVLVPYQKSVMTISSNSTKPSDLQIFHQILSTFKFTNSEITKEDAVNIVLGLAEVKDYISRVKNSKVEYDHESSDGKKIIVHVYEQLPDHAATYNWYEVDKITRETSKEF